MLLIVKIENDIINSALVVRPAPFENQYCMYVTEKIHIDIHVHTTFKVCDCNSKTLCKITWFVFNV